MIENKSHMGFKLWNPKLLRASPAPCQRNRCHETLHWPPK